MFRSSASSVTKSMIRSSLFRPNRYSSAAVADPSSILSSSSSWHRQQCSSYSNTSGTSNAATSAASTNNSNEGTAPNFSQVYVHYLSKLCLERLQSKHSNWLIKNELHRGLQLNSDGTFTLKFPCKVSRNRINPGQIWHTYDIETKRHWLTVSCPDKLTARFMLKNDDNNTRTNTNDDSASANNKTLTKSLSSDSSLQKEIEVTKYTVNNAVDKMINVFNEIHC